MLARNQGARLAGAEAEKFEFRPLFRFKPVELVARQRDTADNRSEVDRRYATANMLAWGLLVFVIGACLWHDAPSWFLLLVCATIGVSMAFSATFKPGVLSKEAIKSDANSGLFFLIGFAPLGLALRAMYRFELIDWRWPLLVAMVIGLPLTLIQMRQIGGFDRHKVGAIVLSAFLCYMGPGSLIWSSLQFANDVGTPDLVASYHVQISAKHEQRGKYDTMYWVNAVDVPDLNGIEKFKLKRLAYERLSVGGDACIQVWRGMLPLRWYEVVQCS